MQKRLVMLVVFVICQFTAVVAAGWMLAAVISGSPRAWTLAKSYDQLGNATAGGSIDEYFSARCYRLREREPYGRLHRWIDALFLKAFGEKEHCMNAYLSEVNQRKALY